MCLLLSAQSVSAQGIWTETSTIGYGAAMGGLGLAACWSGCSVGTAVGLALSSSVVGMYLGYRIGAAAEGVAKRGERPTRAQLLGVRFGTVTAFAALGAGIAALHINSSGGNEEGDDEKTLAYLTLGGAVVGGVIQVLQERGLPEVVSETSLRLAVDPAPFGGMQIGLRANVR